MSRHSFPPSPPSKYGNDEEFTERMDERDHLRNLNAPRVPGDGAPKPSGGLVTDEMYAEHLERHYGIKRQA